MTDKHHQAALAEARKKLIRDMALYAAVPVVACWILWAVLGGGFIWPIIPTIIGAVWSAAVWRRWRKTFVNAAHPNAAHPNAGRPNAGRPPTEPRAPRPTESVSELPRIRFDEEGDPTESFIQELHKRDKDES